jgi:hypothetical protein
LLVLIPFVAIVSFSLVLVLRRRRENALAGSSIIQNFNEASSPAITHEELIEELDIITLDLGNVPRKTFVEALIAFGAFWYDFVIGDDWRMAAGVVVAFALTGWLKSTDNASWVLVPSAVVALLSYSLIRVIRALEFAPVSDS